VTDLAADPGVDDVAAALDEWQPQQAGDIGEARNICWKEKSTVSAHAKFDSFGE
jgi:hypothetical protein